MPPWGAMKCMSSTLTTYYAPLHVHYEQVHMRKEGRKEGRKERERGKPSRNRCRRQLGMAASCDGLICTDLNSAVLLPAAFLREHCSVVLRVKDVLLNDLIHIIQRPQTFKGWNWLNEYTQKLNLFSLLTTVCNAQSACLIRPFLFIKHCARWMSATDGSGKLSVLSLGHTPPLTSVTIAPNTVPSSPSAESAPTLSTKAWQRTSPF